MGGKKGFRNGRMSWIIPKVACSKEHRNDGDHSKSCPLERLIWKPDLRVCEGNFS